MTLEDLKKTSIDGKYMSSVKIGPKGQIVIPKEVRDMFNLNPGDTVVLFADKKRGIAIQTNDVLEQMLKQGFSETQTE